MYIIMSDTAVTEMDYGRKIIIISLCIYLDSDLVFLKSFHKHPP